MSSMLKENYEKVLLAMLLTLLAVVSIVSIFEVDTPKVPEIVGGGKAVTVDVIPLFRNIEAHKLNVADEKSLVSFVYCRNASCNYLIHKGLVKCNWCKTPIISENVIDNDTNRNMIDDKLELKWGLSLDDPNELLRDQDGDGYSTKDEYERDCSPIESGSHPPLALRATFEGVRNKFVPFKINDVVITKDVRGNRRVYIDGSHFKRGSFYLSVGEETDWLKIVNAGEVKGQKFVELQYFDFKFKIFKGQKLQYPTWPKYIIRNGLDGSRVLVSLKEKFTLKSRDGALEEYTLNKFESSKSEIHISSQELSDEFILNQSEELKEPLK